MSPAIEQLNRIRRHLQRIESQTVGDDASDDVRTFFENCWHLKDHITNDSAMPAALRSSVEKEVDRSEPLQICADLANRNKHGKLTRNVRRDARIAGQHIRDYDGTEQRPWVTYEIRLDDGSERDALALARAAVTEWERLLRSYDISI